jgi:hypothetical protein
MINKIYDTTIGCTITTRKEWWHISSFFFY